MLALERKQTIVTMLRKNKKVMVSDLSTMLNVAEETIRRDLKELERKGIAVRAYGGAVLKSDAENLSFLERETKNYDMKRDIAQLTVPLIEDGMVLMADTSTTSKAVIDAIKGKKNITVITNSYKLILDLSVNSNLSLIGTGGNVLPHYQAFVGSDAVRTIRRYNADLAILGINAISRERGFMESNEPESQIKSAMSEYSAKTVIVADNTKFDRVGKVNNFAFDEIDTLVTDRNPGREWCELLALKNVDLICPD